MQPNTQAALIKKAKSKRKLPVVLAAAPVEWSIIKLREAIQITYQNDPFFTECQMLNT